MSKRRMGPVNSEAYQALLDATETVLHDEGYIALTSRRVCEVAGLKPQLLYYYFETMEALVCAAFQRRTQRGLTRLSTALDEAPALGTVFNFIADGPDAALIFEYMALANRNEGIRKDLAFFIEKARRMEVEAIWQQAKAQPRQMPISPAVAAFLLQNCWVMLQREVSVGVTYGHAEVEEFLREVAGISHRPD